MADVLTMSESSENRASAFKLLGRTKGPGRMRDDEVQKSVRGSGRCMPPQAPLRAMEAVLTGIPALTRSRITRALSRVSAAAAPKKLRARGHVSSDFRIVADEELAPAMVLFGEHCAEGTVTAGPSSAGPVEHRELFPERQAGVQRTASSTGGGATVGGRVGDPEPQRGPRHGSPSDGMIVLTFWRETLR